MNLLDLIKPKKNKRLVSKKEYKANLDKHYRLATESLVGLRDAAIEEEDELKIDYFFYSDTLAKAQTLQMEIQKMNFIVNFETASHDKKLFVISGRTPNIKMMHESLSKWVSEMCELGYKHDCTFDSWKIVSELN